MQQSYKVSDTFPFKWINKKWREGFYVTAMATSGSRWGVVMSRGSGFSDQVIRRMIDKAFYISLHCLLGIPQINRRCSLVCQVSECSVSYMGISTTLFCGTEELIMC